MGKGSTPQQQRQSTPGGEVSLELKSVRPSIGAIASSKFIESPEQPKDPRKDHTFVVTESNAQRFRESIGIRRASYLSATQGWLLNQERRRLKQFSVIYKTLQLGVQKNMEDPNRMRRG